ncbi:restriction endonuclease subunit S [Carboxydothermus pertinax]|uniref:Restriction endonuclease subunit S n=1 Tax=Carboxydothermus pertinax TaxID=870242 RepID=A0A1L8CSL7_9THEO|nr:restriction endonuclease subunit S [Carboxydothermus pertinax]GAV21854.1 restriction endonuclease subunit S [Carboxydothermus pertinax]
MGSKDVAFNLSENNLPEGWGIRKLSEIAEINSTCLKKGDKIGKIQYVDISSVGERRILKKVEYSFENAPSRARRKVEDGDTIISTVRPNLKAYAYIKNPPKNLIVSTGFAVVRPKEDYKKYYYYYLTSDQYINYLVLNTRGSAYPAVNVKTIEESNVIFPTSLEAKKIGEILSAFDDKIELNNEMNKTLEEIAKTIFKRWFIDFEFPNEKGKPYKSSGGEFVESELGPIPKGWRVGKLGEIIEITSGKRPVSRKEYRDIVHKIPLVGASSIMGYVKEILYNEPVIIIGRVGTLGVVQRFNEPIWASDNTLVIKSNYHEYVYQLLKLLDYNSLNRGSTQPLLTQNDIKNLPVIIAEKNVILEFEKVSNSIYRRVNFNKKMNDILSQLRDTLLPKLISGEIRVV